MLKIWKKVESCKFVLIFICRHFENLVNVWNIRFSTISNAPSKTKPSVVKATTTTRPVVAKTRAIAKPVTAKAPAEASTRSLRSRKQN
jgi:hypothetical protein